MLDDLDKKELIQIIQKLEKENNELKEKLYGKIQEKEIEIEAKAISSEEKIKIFMEVFKERTDLYAKRWTSNKTGKSGYSPVCKNEFSTYKCDKPRVKCNECHFRELTPLTEDIILKHLKGEITIGIYPLLPGDLCNFLAIDFDKKTFEKDVAAFWNICDELDIPIYVEKSRSGNGAHIWIFFEESIPARIARKMGNILLTKIMEKASLELDSYDRLFPNQDTMPKGGTIFINNVECIFDNQIYIKKLKLLQNEITYLKRLASFTNPKFYELQKLRMPIFYKTTPRIISCFEDDERFLKLPRGLIDKVSEICEKSNVNLIIKDTRENGIETDYKFNGKLNNKQEKAMKELLKHDVGVLCATTGFGKTVVGAKIISELKTNTLVIVNRNNLLEQWKERLSYFLNINKKEIGQIGSGKEKANGKLDVASFQSLFKKDNLEELVKDYGLVIVDECHHAAAYSFDKIIYMQCGDIRVRVSHRELKQNKEIEHTVIVKKTNYKYIPSEEKDKIQISEILNDMCHNIFRNSMIIEDIKKCVLEGRVLIVLTERVEHLKILKESLEDLEVPVVVYKGNMGKKKIKEIQDVIDEADGNNKPRIILATSSSIGEGFDDGRLDTLFLTMPVSWKGRIIQYVGRLHREHEDKEKVIVYDYLDNMKVLEKMYNRRLKGYKIAGYDIIE